MKSINKYYQLWNASRENKCMPSKISISSSKDRWENTKREKRKEKSLLKISRRQTNCDIDGWHTHAGVCASTRQRRRKEKKPNGVYFEIRKRKKTKKSKLNHALLLFDRQKNNKSKCSFIDFVDDNRLSFFDIKNAKRNENDFRFCRFDQLVRLIYLS